MLLGVLAVCAGGCSDAKINDVVVKLFEPKRTPEQQLVVAFAAEDADTRRAALAKVAGSKKYDRGWAVKGYVTVALLDSDPQARCVAVRGLARTGAPEATDTALKLLNHREQPAGVVRPPEAVVRWDAALALARLSAEAQVPEERRDEVRATLIKTLRLDDDRHVRGAAAQGLRHYAAVETVRALVDGLSDADFAVVHECEESLVFLTGTTHGCDALAWSEWVAANEGALFARAGEVPESRRPPYSNRLGKAGYDMKQFMQWLVPARKE